MNTLASISFKIALDLHHLLSWTPLDNILQFLPGAKIVFTCENPLQRLLLLTFRWRYYVHGNRLSYHWTDGAALGLSLFLKRSIFLWIKEDLNPLRLHFKSSGCLRIEYGRPALLSTES